MGNHIQIAMFNHKGGVSKTTSTFHIGWKLAELGHRVLLIDCDPQCNLTGLVLEYGQNEEYPYESSDKDHPRNIRDALAPAFDARPVPLKAVESQPVPRADGLYVLPGHVGFAEFESTLAIAHELSGSLTALQNIPGSLRWVFDLTAQALGAEVVIVDMSPSLGAINQNILTTSDAFIVPMAPDFFSAMALRSLARVLPKWRNWAKRAAEQSILKDAAYPWPSIDAKYIGSIVQNYRRRLRDGIEARPTRAYQKWFDELAAAKTEVLMPALRDSDMALTHDQYLSAEADENNFLLEVPDFNSLIAISQIVSKPVFALTKDDINTAGRVAINQIESIDEFNHIYEEGAKRIGKLCEIIREAR